MLRITTISILATLLGACGPNNSHQSDLATAGPAVQTAGQFTGPAIFLPDAAKTPGILCTTSDPNFQKLRYPERIPYCVRNIGMAEKRQVAAAYGVPESDFNQYEFDHFIPLSIGGSDDPRNLFPQRLDAAHEKDALEMQLFSKMAAGTIKQATAVALIRAWKPSSTVSKGQQ